MHQRFAIKPVVMRESLRNLLHVSNLPNVTIQVMPLSSTPHPGSAGPFSLIRFRGPVPAVVVLENLIGATYIEDAHGVKSYTTAYERIVAAALSPDDSLALIAHLEKGKRT
ncbi:DUF5753 domain-containing protein [Kitasatospora sp. NPDC088351]|uniref:DUF5753 domain-containing protein n=1 Tax=Kitasatospora sp. NPDC088351 TaxID=3155180 RepID=UPI003430F689